MTNALHPRLVGALAKQEAKRQEALAAGAIHLGWKLGVGQRESIAGDIAIGYLTTATCLRPGSTYAATGEDRALHADVELYVEFGQDVPAAAEPSAVEAGISAYGVALEIVDLSPLEDEPDEVVEENLFHRAVAFGPTVAEVARDALASATINGRTAASARVAADVVAKLGRATRLLDASGARFRAGDRVITGSIVQVPVDLGDEVVAAISGVGEAGLTIGD